MTDRALRVLTAVLICAGLAMVAFLATATLDAREDKARCASTVVVLPTDGSPIESCTSAASGTRL